MVFDIITIFPEFFDCFVKESLIKRAQKSGLIKINVHNLRNFTDDIHQVVDDKPFGGGIGMVIKVEPIYRCVSVLTKIKNQFFDKLRIDPERSRRGQKSKIKNTKKKSKIILFTPRGKKFNQRMATEFSKVDQLILICGRYEGIDERVAKHIVDEKISIGNFVMLGGEIAAMTVVEAVSRLIPGIIGKPQLLEQRVTKEKGFIEYPQYTRPELFEPEPGIKWQVPKVLLSGHHKKIEAWRKKHQKIIS